ncbi:prephenate dehydratase [Paenibacillus psychroresistens]|uniref:Prephenate dehydratase n=1 Tax=Paenibacillus psychroresistens TaxID=1778678 RepID=A0A6B8RGW0_9BACL|nr:prephenate dehydratase [Paenibacillus psychroresistens]QGQ95410.1 prephenate dehydratase [Paenibacillus psychroresistens]
MRKIAFLGPEGTVTHEAAHYFFAGEPHQFIPYRLIADAVASTVADETDLSLVPIENTIEGSVKDSIDLLVHGVDLPIQAEWDYPSIQNLIGLRAEYITSSGELDLSRVKKVFSKDVAIAQCMDFIKKHLPNAELEFSSSTAAGVRYVKENPNEGYAAIGSKLATELYQTDLLAPNITDHSNNFTRFLLIGHHPPVLKPSDEMKTTILVTLPEDYPGALHQVLSAFAWRRINLTKIESRPTKLKLGSYYFYIDIKGSLDSVLLPGAIAEIEAIGCLVRVLGSYPSYSYSQRAVL